MIPVHNMNNALKSFAAAAAILPIWKGVLIMCTWPEFYCYPPELRAEVIADYSPENNPDDPAYDIAAAYHRGSGEYLDAYRMYYDLMRSDPDGSPVEIAKAIRDAGSMSGDEFIALVNDRRYGAESSFGAFPYMTQSAVENFWEPGYDYSSAEFWASYGDVNYDFIYATILYDRSQPTD